MTQEEINEGNRLIAEFMGWHMPDSEVYNEHVNIPVELRENRLKTFLLKTDFHKMKFQTSYDWLMPVVENIEAMGYIFDIRRKTCEIATFEKERQILFLLHSETKIQAIYSAVIQFITWHNKIKL